MVSPWEPCQRGSKGERGRGRRTALSDLADARIFAVERRDEHRGLAARVHLEVDRALREDRSCARPNIDLGETRAVLD